MLSPSNVFSMFGLLCVIPTWSFVINPKDIVGHIDFYPNGGIDLAGCEAKVVYCWNNFLIGGCNDNF